MTFLFSQLARNFRFWQQLLAHSEVSRAHSQQRDHNVLRECFEEWRDYTLDVRANKFYVMAMQKKVRIDEINIRLTSLIQSLTVDIHYLEKLSDFRKFSSHFGQNFGRFAET